MAVFKSYLEPTGEKRTDLPSNQVYEDAEHPGTMYYVDDKGNVSKVAQDVVDQLSQELSVDPSKDSLTVTEETNAMTTVSREYPTTPSTLILQFETTQEFYKSVLEYVSVLPPVTTAPLSEYRKFDCPNWLQNLVEDAHKNTDETPGYINPKSILLYHSQMALLPCASCGHYVTKLLRHPFFRQVGSCIRCYTFLTLDNSVDFNPIDYLEDNSTNTVSFDVIEKFTANWPRDEERNTLHCLFCGDGGDIINCDSCSHSLCRRCMERWLGEGSFYQAAKQDTWMCLPCEENAGGSSVLNLAKQRQLDIYDKVVVPHGLNVYNSINQTPFITESQCHGNWPVKLRPMSFVEVFADKVLNVRIIEVYDSWLFCEVKGKKITYQDFDRSAISNLSQYELSPPNPSTSEPISRKRKERNSNTTSHSAKNTTKSNKSNKPRVKTLVEDLSNGREIEPIKVVVDEEFWDELDVSISKPDFQYVCNYIYNDLPKNRLEIKHVEVAKHIGCDGIVCCMKKSINKSRKSLNSSTKRASPEPVVNPYFNYLKNYYTHNEQGNSILTTPVKTPQHETIQMLLNDSNTTPSKLPFASAKSEMIDEGEKTPISNFPSSLIQSSCKPSPICSQNVYNNNGLLLWSGWDVIIECNEYCLCDSKRCLNRVVQNKRKPGFIPQPQLEIFWAGVKGWGVRCVSRQILAGEFVCEYIGEVLSEESAEARQSSAYLFDLTNAGSRLKWSLQYEPNDNIAKATEELPEVCADFVLDASNYGNLGRFLNHSCNGNLIKQYVITDSIDFRLPRVCFFAARDINVGEELTYDYGYRVGSVDGRSLPCHCGAPNCRKVMY